VQRNYTPGIKRKAMKLIPEDVNEILDLCFACWRATAQAYGGLIDKFIGDVVMVVYGLSAVHEDDAEQAIRTALQMRQELQNLNRELEAHYGLNLAMRIGIHTGLAVVSAINVVRGDDFVAVGDTINLASRLQTAASVNEILVSQDVACGSQIGYLSWHSLGAG
jgi:class 3 adenylate cyclase